MDNSAPRKALEYLLSQQDESGLWPFLPQREGALEPSVWSAIALSKNLSSSERFVKRLLQLQNPDGGWSAASVRLDSDWSTGVALFGLRQLGRTLSAGKTLVDLNTACRRAESWLMENRSEHIGGTARFALLLVRGPEYDYPRGWSWTEGTFDFVEPTAYALLGMRQDAAPARIMQASKLAEEFLLDFVCKEGGWNLGDRGFLQTEPIPADIHSTCIALLSLLKRRNEAKVRKSISWLLRQKATLQSAAQISWAALALSAYGEDNSDLLSRLARIQSENGSFSANILTQAAACLAFEVAANPQLLGGEK